MDRALLKYVTAALSIWPSPTPMLPSLTRMNSSSKTSPFRLRNAICPLGSTRAVIRPFVIEADPSPWMEISGRLGALSGNESPVLVFEARAHGASDAQAVLSPSLYDQLLIGILANQRTILGMEHGMNARLDGRMRITAAKPAAHAFDLWLRRNLGKGRGTLPFFPIFSP